MNEDSPNPNPFAAASAVLTPRGVPLIVIPFMQKGPMIFNWPARATSDPARLTIWSNPKYKFNAGSVATPDGFCFLDVDDLDILKEVDIPETFTVASRKGRHYYFAQTDATRRLGNRSLAGRFDFQQSRKQVVSPFSVHPTGFVYTVISDAPIVPVPDALAEWIDSKSEAQSLSTPDDFKKGEGLWVGGTDVTPDQFETWLELHGESFEDGHYDKNSNRWGWIRTDRCPWEEEHTNKNGDRDFKLFLHDLKGPQCYCVHSHTKRWKDYRQFLGAKSGTDFSMKTGEKLKPASDSVSVTLVTENV